MDASGQAPAVEQIILWHGHRSMERLAQYLPPNYAEIAARALLNNRARVLITTGFYVQGYVETDGPPGALFLGRALARQGAQVAFVCEAEPLKLLETLAGHLWGDNGSAPEFIEFPIADRGRSANLARHISSTWQPSAIVAVERCGRTRSGAYRNIAGKDITSWTAQVDDLFSLPGRVTLGVGDGGNEIGMGTLGDQTASELGIAEPVATSVNHLVVATVSNWGAFGIIAYLSAHAGHDLLPAAQEEVFTLELLVKNGAVDGMTGRSEPGVDGFPATTDLEIVEALRGTLAT